MLSHETRRNNSKTYNHIIAIGETYSSFYPEYSFSVYVNSEPFIIDNLGVDFLNHTYKTEK